MPFQRVWDSSCPQIYDKWESDGANWVIQDLLPEDDDEALKLMMENLLPDDETMLTLSGIPEEESSKQNMQTFWRHHLSKRMALACYHLKEGKRTLAGLNCCYVMLADEKETIPGMVEGVWYNPFYHFQVDGAAWRNVVDTLAYIDSKLNAFKYLETDKLLYAVGLVVRRDYRGAKLGSRLLAAREPLCKSLGIPTTSTVFTGVASQKSAARAGFTEVLSVTLRELADAGLTYPRDDRCIKLMVKKMWDSSCPQVYDKWESDEASWVIQDLLPEDDDEALKLMMENLLPDEETLFRLSGVSEEKASKQNMQRFWKHHLSKRMTLACYHLKEGRRTLAALNCCYVILADGFISIISENIPGMVDGAAWRNVAETLVYIDSKLNAFKYLETDKLLYAVGLVVRRDYRGANLGARLLAAREPLCKYLGITCTSTLFTGVRSQKSAARAGFTEALSVTLGELADAGLNYPRDDRCMKIMVKKYA
ncbi:uncharacterized protein LOC113232755 [Hyposmocoma kahamanoa]|uniref:uncharacterized protein LOC113232755 n=1 Tax=Hyposmocoma kahamanoa TaxID=1477025 RepID=UPI000E6D88EF|nr:uncharacterized protein LOC113232755 [Hyposmocoma kahamanoa]